jgi:hypothetical protein
MSILLLKQCIIFQWALLNQENLIFIGKSYHLIIYSFQIYFIRFFFIEYISLIMLIIPIQRFRIILIVSEWFMTKTYRVKKKLFISCRKRGRNGEKHWGHYSINAIAKYIVPFSPLNSLLNYFYACISLNWNLVF